MENKNKIANYSRRCICLQQMAKIKGNQNKCTLCSDCCELLLIPPLHYCLSHTEPTPNSNLENPSESHHLYFPWGGMGGE